MDIKLVNKGTIGELILIGRLTSNNADDVEKIALEQANRFQELELNLGNLEYIASAGLRIILKLTQFMDNKGGKLTIKNTPKSIMEIFELTGFSGILNFK